MKVCIIDACKEDEQKCVMEDEEFDENDCSLLDEYIKEGRTHKDCVYYVDYKPKTPNQLRNRIVKLLRKLDKDSLIRVEWFVEDKLKGDDIE